MRFDDGTRNGQAKSHAGLFGRKKAVKEPIEMLRLDAGAAVLERAAEAVRIKECGSNSKPPASRFRLRHGLDRVGRQVDKHLLKLRAIPKHFRCRRVGVVHDHQPMRLDFMTKECQGLADDLVDPQQCLFGRLPRRHRSNTR
jgi:hypothetical protein